jgi:hypothetical protein
MLSDQEQPIHLSEMTVEQHLLNKQDDFVDGHWLMANINMHKYEGRVERSS